MAELSRMPRLRPCKSEEPKKRRDSLRPQALSSALALQQHLGNQAAYRLLQSGILQPKLTVSQPGDRHEQEADQVADRILRMPDAAPVSCAAPVAIQRMCSECQEELPLGGIILPKERHGPVSASSVGDVENEIQQVRRGGEPLSDSVRSFFEPRFGSDLSHVRIHTDTQAADSADAVEALAYTVGSDIVFSRGRYAPDDSDGRRLLAHELTHVIQQTGERSLPEEPSCPAMGDSRVPGPAAAPTSIARLTYPAVHDRRRSPVGQKCGAGDKGTCRFPGIAQGRLCFESSEGGPSAQHVGLAVGGVLGAIAGGLLGAGVGTLALPGGGTIGGGIEGAALGSGAGASLGSAIGLGIGNLIDWLSE